MLRVLIPFALGIVLQYNIRVPLLYLTFLPVLLFILLCFLLKYRSLNCSYVLRRQYGLIFNLFVLAVSMGLTGNKMLTTSFIDDLNSGDDLIVSRIVESPLERDRTFRLLIEPEVIISGDTCRKTSGRAIAWVEKDSSSSTLTIGDHIVMQNRFREIRNHGNPWEFNYRQYTQMQGIFGEIYLPKDSWFRHDGAGRSQDIRLFPAKLRDHLLDVLKNRGITGKEYAVASALLLGYRRALDDETRQVYAGSGAMHILAVSGLHVGILYIFLAWFAGLFRSIKYYPAATALFMIVIIWFYAMLTGLSPSVTRAATMFSFLAFARSMNKTAFTFNTLATAALVQLIANPFSLFMVGFQLSYLAVAGIVYYQPALYSLLNFRGLIGDRVWALVSLSCSAQLLIFPLIIYYFNQFPVYFPVTNVFAVPLATVVLYGGLSLFLFSAVPFMGSVFAFILNSALVILNFITTLISSLPYATITGISASLPLLLIIYGIILCATLFIAWKKSVYLHLAFLLIISALVLRAETKIRTAGQNIFIVYNNRNVSMYNFISGRNNIIISSDNEHVSEAAIPWCAAGPARHLRTRDPGVYSPSAFFNTLVPIEPELYPAGGNLVFFAGYTIYFAGPENRPGINEISEPVNVDMLVISSPAAGDLPAIQDLVKPSLVIIDSSVTGFQKAGIIEQCLENGLDYHDVSTSGAFVAGLNK